MICTFFGHKDTPDSVALILRNTINCCIEEGVRLFIVGNNGNFDFLVQKTLEEISVYNKEISYHIYLTRPNEKAISGNQKTLFLQRS